LSETKAQYQCASREEAVEKYKEYLLEKVGSKDILICIELNKIYKKAKVNDVNLVCFCVPNLCHGHIIKQIIDEKLKNS
jgi:hypothetical protein